MTERLEEFALQLHPTDDVAVVRKPIRAGLSLMNGQGPFEAKQDIPQGHKIALHPIAVGTFAMAGVGGTLLGYQGSTDPKAVVAGSLAMACFVCGMTGLLGRAGLRVSDSEPGWDSFGPRGSN